MKHVYLLRSEVGAHYYVGITDDLYAQLKMHNAGKVSRTSKNKPWNLKNSIAFSTESKFFVFVRYLQSLYNRAFTQKEVVALCRFFKRICVMPLVYRLVYFFLLGGVCIARYFAFNVWTPEKGGDGPAPGDGLLFFFELILSNLIVLPLCLLFWGIGFRQARLRKAVLMLGLFVIDWPVLLMLAALLVSPFLHRS